VLAFGFTEKRKFVAKTDRNSIFYGREAHIPCRLHIMVMYRKFYRFLKNLNFGSKSKVVSLLFTENASLRQKTDQNFVLFIVKSIFSIGYR
jgi:hypothetical protein